MDDTESKIKKRVLPSWMIDDNSHPKKRCTTEAKGRKKTQGSSRNRTVYCMNEKELVECALEILNQGKVHRDIEEKNESELQEDKEDSSLDTDIDKKPVISPASDKPQTIPLSSDELKHDSDDDPLKYVREIFFC
ncbi:cell cycle regulator of non-homologous end joining-like [Bufo gargarizans]|uniref:cell cycle regulator of non-homologous end joining-like n=1 Tax=Bufo gargarizans TaxID=30331 RepID=UPI001CF38CF1|nr:cell cycle regulator of non-homologous end joining-like [Bufo gargarizans]